MKENIGPNVPEIAGMLRLAGNRFTGECAITRAQEWVECGFSVSEVAAWIREEIFNPETALSFLAVDMAPYEVSSLMTATFMLNNRTNLDVAYFLCNHEECLTKFVEAALLLRKVLVSEK